MRSNIQLFIFLLVGACLAFVSCKSNNNKTGEPESRHKKRPVSPIVKSIKKYGSTGRNGNDTLLQLEEFDTKGYKTRLVKYAPEGSFEYEIRYTNNEDGKTVRAVTRYSDSSTDIEEHTYNSDGKVTETRWQRSDGTSGKHAYKFDDEGTMIQWDWFEKDRFVISRLYPTTYNDEGKPSESSFRETSNNRDTTTNNNYQYTYDDKNRLIRKISMEEELPVGLEEFMYDLLDNRIVEIYYEPDSVNSGTLTLSHKQFNTYNEYGELTQYQSAKGKGNPELTVTNSYDEFGHLTRTVYEYVHGFYRTEKFVYEFYKKD